MSYARFGWDGSNVYVYLDCGGYLTCCGCSLSGEVGRAWFYNTTEMLAHLRLHQKAGHVVPDDTIADLEADREENDAWIAEEQRKQVSR